MWSIFFVCMMTLKLFPIYILLYLSYFTTSCAMAPLVTQKSAATLGTGQWELATGAFPAYLSAHRGLSENMDIGVNLEFLFHNKLELVGKYAFLNNATQGTSLALTGSIFTGEASIGTNTGFRIGPIISHKIKNWELYATCGYNAGKWNLADGVIKDDEGRWVHHTGVDHWDLFIDGDKNSFFYMKYTVGSSFHFTNRLSMNLSIHYLALSTGVDIVLPPAVGLSLMY